MAGTKISEATLRSALQGTENLPIVDTDLAAGRTTINDIKDYVQPDLSNYLAKDNATEFTPTGDYNPATKKYVDDSIPNTSGFVTTESLESTLTEYAKTSDIPDTSSFVTNTSLESALADYAKITDIPDTSDILTKTEAASTYQEKVDYATTTEAGLMSAAMCTKLDSIEEGADVTSVTPTVTNGTAIATINGTTIYAPTAEEPDLSNYLAKDNTEEYTPTEDYHPATKKYVDDVLATLQAQIGQLTQSQSSENFVL